MQLYLFNHTLSPKALYGRERWGFENSQIIEHLQNEFLNLIVGLRKRTSEYMTHAEMGWHLI